MHTTLTSSVVKNALKLRNFEMHVLTLQYTHVQSQYLFHNPGEHKLPSLSFLTDSSSNQNTLKTKMMYFMSFLVKIK